MSDTLQECSPIQLERQIARQQPLQLVDVREYPEFAAGHIAGAILVPLSVLPERAGNLPRDVPITLMCRSGKRSGLAQTKLRELGFTHVNHLVGGINAWTEAGMPLESQAHPPWSLERQVRLVAGLLVLVGLALSYVWKPAIVLSWLIPAGLVFAALTDTCAMGMLLAKLPWNRSS